MNIQQTGPENIPLISDVDGTVVDFYQGLLRNGLAAVINGYCEEGGVFGGFATERPNWDQLHAATRWQISHATGIEDPDVSAFGIGINKTQAIVNAAAKRAEARRANQGLDASPVADLVVLENWPQRFGRQVIDELLERNGDPELRIAVGIVPSLRPFMRDRRIGKLARGMFERQDSGEVTVKGFEVHNALRGDGAVSIGASSIYFTQVGHSIRKYGSGDGADLMKRSRHMAEIEENMSINYGRVTRSLPQPWA